MNKKHSVSSLINMLYVLLVIYFIETITIAQNLGIFSNESSINVINPSVMESNLSMQQIIFNFLFIGFICCGVIIEGRDLEVDEDENKIKVVNRKLLKYKIFVSITILFSTYLIIKSYNSQLIYSCILLNLASLFIFYGKSIYFKSYICNRRLDWLRKTSKIDIDDYIDTKWWRRKIWFNGKEKVPLKYRIYNIIISSFISTISFIALLISKSFFLFSFYIS